MIDLKSVFHRRNLLPLGHDLAILLACREDWILPFGQFYRSFRLQKGMEFCGACEVGFLLSFHQLYAILSTFLALSRILLGAVS